MNKKQSAALEKHFKWWNDNPPAPFNPEYRPYAVQLSNEVTQSMEEDNFYHIHTKEECRKEWARRYERLRPGYEKTFQQQKRKQS